MRSFIANSRNALGTVNTFFGAVMFLLATLSAAADAAETKRVLMLYSFGPESSWNQYAKNIRAELEQQSRWPLEISDYSIVTARSSDEDSPFVEYLRALHAKWPFDLVVCLGAPAVVFVQRHRQELLANTPMVFTAFEQRRIQYSTLTANDTVVALAHSFPAIFDDILRVLPDTKTVAVVNGNSPNENFWVEQIRKDASRFADRLTFKWYNELSFEDILKDAAALPPHSAIFWHLMNVDAAGRTHERDSRELKRLYAVADAPIFSHTDTSFGDGIVGGPMHSVSELSRLAASVAIRILGGEKAGGIKTPASGFATPKFDWREMQRWGISESSLMPGSEIYFHELTVWEQYRAAILMIAAVMVLQAALIFWLLHDRAQRRRSELKRMS